jgi:hypothetical protein
MMLGMWITGQAIVLVMQHLYGPRWFIPQWFEPKKYNYYRTIPQELLGDDEYNCVICMHPINIMEQSTAIEMEEEPSSSSSNSNNRQHSHHHHSVLEAEEKPVVTPCSHIFHEACLRRWMSYSTLCPTCRTALADGL